MSSSVDVRSRFYKGPVTCIEYLNDKYIVAGCGSFLLLIESKSLGQVNKTEVLKYCVLHGIKINSLNQDICVYGQKSLNICYFNSTKEQIQTRFEIPIEFNDWIWEIEWAYNQLLIVTAHNNFIVFDSDNNSIIRTQDCSQKCMLYSAKIFFYEDKVLIASGTIYNRILIWDSTNGEILLTLSGHEGVIFKIGFDFDESLLYSASDDRSIMVWKLDFNDKLLNAQSITRFFGHEARIWSCICFKCPKGKTYLCSTGEDLNCFLWDIYAKSCVYKFSTNKKGSKNIWCQTLNRKTYELVTGWQDGGLRKYELMNYLSNQNDECSSIDVDLEYNINYDDPNDYYRCFQVIANSIIITTNLGHVYYICLNEELYDQKIIFSDSNLSSFSCMAKFDQKYVAIGSLSGSIYLIYEFISKSIPMYKHFNFENDTDVTGNNKKILNIQFQKSKNGIYLLASFTFLDGLMKLYKLNEETINLELITRLYLPICKQRWFSSFAIYQEENLFLTFVGDKCGNLHFYEVAGSPSITLQPIQSLTKITKTLASIQAIYLKDDHIICCSRDGFYSLYEIDYNEKQLTFVNKFEINSSIDFIESLIFNETNSVDLESSLALALCFYGDKFLIWSFFSNRPIMEVKCGGANRVWDYEIKITNDDILCRFFYQKLKNIIKIEKKFSRSEIIPQTINSFNHITQVFHGNNITCCKLFKSYIITGSEDTRVIISRLSDNLMSVSHLFYLQGHDSVIKCIDITEINVNKHILLTAGGKANLKLWEIHLKEEVIEQVVQKCEFKRFFNKSKSFRELDVRFMDCFIQKLNENDIIVCLACSDGCIRVFLYSILTNRLELKQSIEYSKCLLSLKHLRTNDNISFLTYTATDGHFFINKFVHDRSFDNILKLKLHQSGINSFDAFWTNEARSKALLGTVGDDACVAISQLQIVGQNKFEILKVGECAVAHASSIIGKFTEFKKFKYIV